MPLGGPPWRWHSANCPRTVNRAGFCHRTSEGLLVLSRYEQAEREQPRLCTPESGPVAADPLVARKHESALAESTMRARQTSKVTINAVLTSDAKRRITRHTATYEE